jgi:hypothetical protein
MLPAISQKKNMDVAHEQTAFWYPPKPPLRTNEFKRAGCPSPPMDIPDIRSPRTKLLLLSQTPPQEECLTYDEDLYKKISLATPPAKHKSVFNERTPMRRHSFSGDWRPKSRQSLRPHTKSLDLVDKDELQFPFTSKIHIDFE